MKLLGLLQQQRTSRPSPQAIALRILIGFLAFMVLLTLLARAADTLTNANVSTEKPTRAALTHSVQADGRLVADGEIAIPILDGARVEQVAVKEGSLVQEGDLLFALDLDDLREQAQKLQLEQQKRSLQLDAAKRKSERVAQRADEDLGNAEDDAQFQIEAAEDAVSAALGELRRFREDYEEILRNYRSRDTLDPADPDFAIVNQYRVLRDQYQAQEKAYEDACRAQEKSLLDAQRQLEDAQETDSSAQITAIDYQLGQMELNRLQAWIAAEGRVTADEDAVVAKVAIGAGRVATGSEPALLLTPRAEGYRLVASVDRDGMKYVSTGTTANVMLAGSEQILEGLPIDSIRAATDGSNGGEVNISIPAELGEVGMLATMEVTQKTGYYETCLPLSALHRDGPQYYVLVSRAVETVLGEGHLAERIDVTVLDQNEQRAAVSGGLMPDDQVIISSSKTIGAGDRIRLQSE